MIISIFPSSRACWPFRKVSTVYCISPHQRTIPLQWDLVCSKDMLPETSLTVFNVGVMLGAILFGFLSDKFGRKRCFVCALFLQVGTSGCGFHCGCVLLYFVYSPYRVMCS